MRLRGAVAALLLACAAPASAFDLGAQREVGGVTPFSEADLAESFAFTRKDPPAFADVPWVHLALSPYTDRPAVWNRDRSNAALGLARHTFARCRIRLDIGEMRALRRVPRGDGLRFHRFRRTDDPLEMVAFFSDDFGGERFLGQNEGPTALDGRIEPRKMYVRHNGAFPVYTTLPHLIAKHLGLVDSTERDDLMLNYKPLMANKALLATAALAWFEPRRFRFSDDGCARLRRSLESRRRERARPANVPAHWRSEALDPVEVEEVMVATVERHDSYRLAVRIAGAWQGFQLHLRAGLGKLKLIKDFRVEGIPHGRAFLTAAGYTLFVGEDARGRMRIQWDHDTPRRRAGLKRRALACDHFLTAGTLRHGASPAAVVVCTDAIHVLFPQRTIDDVNFGLVAAAHRATLSGQESGVIVARLWTTAGDQFWRITPEEVLATTRDPVPPLPLPDWDPPRPPETRAWTTFRDLGLPFILWIDPAPAGERGAYAHVEVLPE